MSYWSRRDGEIFKLRFRLINFYKYFLSYGCVVFDTAGDEFFIHTNLTENCVSQCLDKDAAFQFFITSFFTG
jgi:hypothetical protein